MKVKRALLIAVMMTMTSSCASRKPIVPAYDVNNIIQTDRYSYVKDEEGRWYIVTSTSRDLDEAMKKIRPGPSSVDKIDVWVVTPLQPSKR